ncbi:MAG: cysteine--tRNA ligase, partial [Microbacteriaceae bacterium]
MAIRIYDSLSGQEQEFRSIREGEVGIYLCGPTVQSSPHIGHLRSALVYDLWRNWFEHRNYRVTMVRNVTDIDDKILINAAASQLGDHPEQWWQLAYRVEQEFNQAYRALGIPSPTIEPRATGHITQMVTLIERLIAGGHAYAAKDGSGDVYFAVRSWPKYGELTRQNIDDMVDAGDAEPRAKQDPRDFALWKGHKADEPLSASWPSPWGIGRPGWHIECSAMSTAYLGAQFDIHGGGLDLRFPHHENELAQSHAAGDPFANIWIHNGLVNIAGQKMSKSLGNSVFAADVLALGRPIVLRYFLLTAHYRSVLDFSESALAEAGAAFERIEGFLSRANAALDGAGWLAVAHPEVPQAFAEKMDSDLNTPEALAVLHDTVRRGNVALDSGDFEGVALARSEVELMLDVLGLNAASEAWKQQSGSADAEISLAKLISSLIDERNQARSAKDFA